MQRKVNVVEDLNENKIVVIHDIIFKGKRSMEGCGRVPANAKAKANAAQGVPEMLLIANEREFEKNRKDKYLKNAKYGWYSYVTRFALPVYGDNGNIGRYNVFRAVMLVRHAEDKKLHYMTS